MGWCLSFILRWVAWDIRQFVLYINKSREMSTSESESNYNFTYNGVQYDANDYVTKHPGGIQFLKNMKAMTNDFSEYFRALHSDQAEKILKSMPVVSVKTPTKSSETYIELYKIMEPYFVPNWPIEIALLCLVTGTFVLGLTSTSLLVASLSFALSQIVTGWIGHSAAHNRTQSLREYGVIVMSLVGGFSLEWWTPKHNMHHMFTNIQKYDEDIQHKYKVYLFQFLYLKWRFDSIVSAFTQKNYLEGGLIIMNYAFLLYFHRCLLGFLLGQLLAGFYSAFVLIGNHEREVRFAEKPNMTFMDHQIITCRNYREQSLIWLILMGGMQFQTEHHLFPQIPFYNLPTVKPIITKFLTSQGKTIIYGAVV